MKHVIGSLQESPSCLDTLDRKVLNKDLWLKEDEKKRLQKSRGKAVLIYEDNILVAAGYFVPATEMTASMKKDDRKYRPQRNEVYIYSVVVLPDWRRKGLGTKIRRELCALALADGFESGVTHVRFVNNWANAGIDFYKPFAYCRVKNFWAGNTDEERDVLRLHFNLPK